MYSAKVTSKGQVTVPVEIRRALGVNEGDFVAFEMRGDYAVVRRQRSLRELSEEWRASNGRRTAAYASDDEAVASAFADAAAEDPSAPLLLLRPKPRNRR